MGEVCLYLCGLLASPAFIWFRGFMVEPASNQTERQTPGQTDRELIISSQLINYNNVVKLFMTTSSVMSIIQTPIPTMPCTVISSEFRLSDFNESHRQFISLSVPLVRQTSLLTAQTGPSAASVHTHFPFQHSRLFQTHISHEYKKLDVYHVKNRFKIQTQCDLPVSSYR